MVSGPPAASRSAAHPRIQRPEQAALAAEASAPDLQLPQRQLLLRQGQRVDAQPLVVGARLLLDVQLHLPAANVVMNSHLCSNCCAFQESIVSIMITGYGAGQALHGGVQTVLQYSGAAHGSMPCPRHRLGRVFSSAEQNLQEMMKQQQALSLLPPRWDTRPAAGALPAVAPAAAASRSPAAPPPRWRRAPGTAPTRPWAEPYPPLAAPALGCRRTGKALSTAKITHSPLAGAKPAKHTMGGALRAAKAASAGQKTQAPRLADWNMTGQCSVHRCRELSTAALKLQSRAARMQGW